MRGLNLTALFFRAPVFETAFLVDKIQIPIHFTLAVRNPHPSNADLGCWGRERSQFTPILSLICDKQYGFWWFERFCHKDLLLYLWPVPAGLIVIYVFACCLRNIHGSTVIGLCGISTVPITSFTIFYCLLNTHEIFQWSKWVFTLFSTCSGYMK